MNLKKLLFILISCFSLAACNTEKNSSEVVKSIEIQETADFSKVKPNSLKTISNKEEVMSIQEVVNKANKIDGVVDIASPQYKMKLNDTEYFLWINDDHRATIMNVKDTNTIYKIDSAKKMNKMIKDLYESQNVNK